MAADPSSHDVFLIEQRLTAGRTSTI